MENQIIILIVQNLNLIFLGWGEQQGWAPRGGGGWRGGPPRGGRGGGWRGGPPRGGRGRGGPPRGRGRGRGAPY